MCSYHSEILIVRALFVASRKMSSIEEEISSKIAEDEDKDLLNIWQTILSKYHEGGPDAVERHFDQSVKEIRSNFSEEVREIESGRSVTRLKKVTRRKR